MQDFEKLGLFYLGRRYDLQSRAPADDLILYESKDLVTHGVCVGMTGSGKTGLCLTVLEEAAIDGIPVIALDPKGDLANLFLTFPELRGSDFLPWINEADAKNAGIEAAEFADREAEKWKSGLAAWGEDGDRIRRLRDAVDLGLYTPGSEIASPISILHSFEAPSAAVLGDSEALHDRVGSIVTGLLGLLGIDADPLQSREHILLSNLLTAAWSKQQTLDLAGLIGQIQSPPIERIGVLDMETFYPTKDRVALAMRINNLLAAPSFGAWLKGETLDIARLLYTAEGKPRISIISIAHLNDAERMFFVTLLLSELVSWMRSQSGTTSLRALFYMDEIFGYFPPVANPPSKQPLLTLLKQARAFGLGVLLATQNPVDLDYKGLSNTGTWFIGRLQTERDKARVLDGLEGAAASSAMRFDRKQMEALLSGLGNRVFLMNNVHEDGPVVFQVRWTLSYLRGPLARDQLRQLAAQQSQDLPPPPPTETSTTPQRSDAPTKRVTVERQGLATRPAVAAEIPQYFLQGDPGDASTCYLPAVLGRGRVYFHDRKTGIDQEQAVCTVVLLGEKDRTVDWNASFELAVTDRDLLDHPIDEATYRGLPAIATRAQSISTWTKSFADWLYRGQKLELLQCADLKQFSQPGEPERDFAARLQQSLREERDRELQKLREKHAAKVAAIGEKIRRARAAVERESGQASERKTQTAISFGSTILSAIFGRKTISATSLSKAATAARGVGRSVKESQDVARASENLDSLVLQQQELEAKLADEVTELIARWENRETTIEPFVLKPKRADVSVDLVAVLWLPESRSPKQ